ALPSLQRRREPSRQCAPLLIFPGSFPAEQEAGGPGEYHAAAGQYKDRGSTEEVQGRARDFPVSPRVPTGDCEGPAGLAQLEVSRKEREAGQKPRRSPAPAPGRARARTPSPRDASRQERRTTSTA